MGLLGWLIAGALLLGGAILVAEAVSYYVNRQGLIGWIRNKRAAGQIPSSAVSIMIKNQDGHKVKACALDSGGNQLGDAELSSSAGISNDIRANEIIDID